ncbi:hypothetical protein RCL1_005773 [Eukaryota sp. TZLM3-RCL]
MSSDFEFTKRHVLGLAQAIIKQLDLPIFVADINHITSSFIAVVIEKVLHTRLPNLVRPPKSKADHIQNITIALHYLAEELKLRINVDPVAVYKHDLDHLLKVVNVLAALSGATSIRPLPSRSTSHSPTPTTSRSRTSVAQSPESSTSSEEDIELVEIEDEEDLTSPLPPPPSTTVTRAYRSSKIHPPKSVVFKEDSVKRVAKRRPRTPLEAQPPLTPTERIAPVIPSSSIAHFVRSFFEYQQLSQLELNPAQTRKLEMDLEHLLKSFNSLTQTTETMKKAAENRLNKQQDVQRKARQSTSRVGERSKSKPVDEMIERTVNKISVASSSGALVTAMREAREIERQMKHEEEVLKREITRKARFAVERAGDKVEHQLLASYSALQQEIRSHTSELERRAAQEKHELRQLEVDRKSRIQDLLTSLRDQLSYWEVKNQDSAQRLVNLYAKKLALSR